MKLRPLQDRVIVKQSEAEEKTKSGILLPDAAKEKPTKGKVVAVGPGKLDDNGKPMEIGLRVGDTVYYGKYSGTDVEVDGRSSSSSARRTSSACSNKKVQWCVDVG
jgi:chaperonin GroES